MNSISYGAIIGGLASLLLMMWLSAKKGEKYYPQLRIAVPEGMEQHILFQQWCQAKNYRQKEGKYVKGRGWLTSMTEISFENNEMIVLEGVNFVFTIKYYALNAPLLVGKPVRSRKLKQLNQLMRAFNLPEIDWASK